MSGAIEHRYTGHGPKVAILGDSLTVFGWNAIYDDLDREYAVEIAAINGEGYNPGALSTTLGHGRGALLPTAAEQAARSHPAVVVLALGTNDAWRHRDETTALTSMRKMVAGFGRACLVGVTIPEVSKVAGWSEAEARALNAAMRKWAKVVVDWATMSREPGIIGPDGVHPTADGTTRRSASIAAAVRRCRP